MVNTLEASTLWIDRSLTLGEHRRHILWILISASGSSPAAQLDRKCGVHSLQNVCCRKAQECQPGAGKITWKEKKCLKETQFLPLTSLLLGWDRCLTNGENRGLVSLLETVSRRAPKDDVSFHHDSDTVQFSPSQVVCFIPYTICTGTVTCPCPFLTSSYPQNAA